MKMPENFISPGVMAGISGQGNKKKERRKKCTDIPSECRPGMNERVYVSAVADRVNVGKDEGLRFSGWIELERGGGGRGNEDDRGRIRVAGKQATLRV